MVQNSDSEQCTESKLGWVHQVHTLAQAARTAPRPAVSQLCCGMQGAVSQAQHRPYRGHVAACTRALLRSVLQQDAAVSPGMSRHTPTAKPLPSCHDTIVCIVTRFANQTAHLSRYKDCIVTQPPAASPSLLS